MDKRTSDDVPSAASTAVRITVIDVQPLEAGKLFGLATDEIDIDGIIVAIHGIQAVQTQGAGIQIDPPKFRDAGGQWRTAVTLPDEIKKGIGQAVMDAMVERGISASRFGRS